MLWELGNSQFRMSNSVAKIRFSMRTAKWELESVVPLLLSITIHEEYKRQELKEA